MKPPPVVTIRARRSGPRYDVAALARLLLRDTTPTQAQYAAARIAEQARRRPALRPLAAELARLVSEARS